MSKATHLDNEIVLQFFALLSELGNLIGQLSSIASLKLVSQEVQLGIDSLKFEAQILFLSRDLLSLINEHLQSRLVLLIVLKGNFASTDKLNKVFIL